MKPFQSHDTARGLARATEAQGGRRRPSKRTQLAAAHRHTHGVYLRRRVGQTAGRAARGERSGTLLTRLVYLECGAGGTLQGGGGGGLLGGRREGRLSAPAGPLSGKLTAHGGNVSSVALHVQKQVDGSSKYYGRVGRELEKAPNVRQQADGSSKYCGRVVYKPEKELRVCDR